MLRDNPNCANRIIEGGAGVETSGILLRDSLKSYALGCSWDCRLANDVEEA